MTTVTAYINHPDRVGTPIQYTITCRTKGRGFAIDFIYDGNTYTSNTNNITNSIPFRILNSIIANEDEDVEKIENHKCHERVITRICLEVIATLRSLGLFLLLAPGKVADKVSKSQPVPAPGCRGTTCHSIPAHTATVYDHNIRNQYCDHTLTQ